MKIDLQVYYELCYSVLTANQGKYAVKDYLVDVSFYRSTHDFLLSVYGLKQRLLDISKQADEPTEVLGLVSDFVRDSLNPFLCVWHPKFFSPKGNPTYRKMKDWEREWWDDEVRALTNHSTALLRKVSVLVCS